MGTVQRPRLVFAFKFSTQHSQSTLTLTLNIHTNSQHSHTHTLTQTLIHIHIEIRIKHLDSILGHTLRVTNGQQSQHCPLSLCLSLCLCLLLTSPSPHSLLLPLPLPLSLGIVCVRSLFCPLWPKIEKPPAVVKCSGVKTSFEVRAASFACFRSLSLSLTL